jgi:hypothetical protein
MQLFVQQIAMPEADCISAHQVRGTLWRNAGDYADDGALYHAVDAIDIEMEASSEIDVIDTPVVRA